MPVIDDQGRTEPPFDADEVGTLLGFLDYQRQTLQWKTDGVGADGLRRTTAASTMTLAGLLKHMAFVEDHWFGRALRDDPVSPPFDTVDWSTDNDWEWRTAADDSPEYLRQLWTMAVERSRHHVAEALTAKGLDTVAAHGWPNGTAPNLRWIVVHMIEEYARHNGHADLLREVVDGETGE